MRSIIYAAYSKDLSVKTTTAKIQMMKQGKYVGGYAPYGYVLHPEIRNKLKLDPEAAEVVRRVFNEALKGRNTSQIALSLNDDNIPTPGQYFKGKHPDKKKYSRMSEKISWTASMVYKILTSYVYKGQRSATSEIRRRRFSENYFSKERGLDHRRRDARSDCQQGRV